MYYTTSRRLQTYSDVLANGQTSRGRGGEAEAAQDRKEFLHNLLSGLSKFLKNTKALKRNRLIEGEKKNTSKKKSNLTNQHIVCFFSRPRLSQVLSWSLAISGRKRLLSQETGQDDDRAFKVNTRTVTPVWLAVTCSNHRRIIMGKVWVNFLETTPNSWNNVKK